MDLSLRSASEEGAVEFGRAGRDATSASEVGDCVKLPGAGFSGPGNQPSPLKPLETIVRAAKKPRELWQRRGCGTVLLWACVIVFLRRCCFSAASS